MGECVSCGVQTVCLNTCLKASVVPRTAFSMAWVVSYWPLTMEDWSDPVLVHVRHVVYKAVLGQVSLPVLPFSHLSIIPQVPHTHPHFNTTKSRRSVSSIEPANKEIRFRMFGNFVEKSAYTFIFCA